MDIPGGIAEHVTFANYLLYIAALVLTNSHTVNQMK